MLLRIAFSRRVASRSNIRYFRLKPRASRRSWTFRLDHWAGTGSVAASQALSGHGISSELMLRTKSINLFLRMASSIVVLRYSVAIGTRWSSSITLDAWYGHNIADSDPRLWKSKRHNLMHLCVLFLLAGTAFQARPTPGIAAPLTRKTVLAVVLGALLVRLWHIYQTCNSFNSLISHQVLLPYINIATEPAGRFLYYNTLTRWIGSSRFKNRRFPDWLLTGRIGVNQLIGQGEGNHVAACSDDENNSEVEDYNDKITLHVLVPYAYPFLKKAICGTSAIVLSPGLACRTDLTAFRVIAHVAISPLAPAWLY